jgi:hypothetical protein
LVNDLIDLVEEIEVIWNAKAKVYHDKDKRKEAILFFDIWMDLFQEHIKCFRKIGWSSIPSKFIKVRQSF